MAAQRPNTILPGIVETVIEFRHPNEPEKAQIAIEGAEYREMRIENTLKDENSGEVSLKPGAQVKVTTKAERTATIAKR